MYFLSLDAPEDQCECGSLYDAIADERTNIERNVQDAFDLEQLTQAMQALTDEERYLICG